MINPSDIRIKHTNYAALVAAGNCPESTLAHVTDTDIVYMQITSPFGTNWQAVSGGVNLQVAGHFPLVSHGFGHAAGFKPI